MSVHYSLFSQMVHVLKIFIIKHFFKSKEQDTTDSPSLKNKGDIRKTTLRLMWTKITLHLPRLIIRTQIKKQTHSDTQQSL